MWNFAFRNHARHKPTMRVTTMNHLRITASALALALHSFAASGCAFLAASGDIEDGSAEATTAKDHDDRMRRMREGGTLRPGEYDALREKMGDGKNGEVTSKPSIEELEQRVEAAKRKNTAAEAAQ
jgi:hypothetical protein